MRKQLDGANPTFEAEKNQPSGGGNLAAVDTDAHFATRRHASSVSSTEEKETHAAPQSSPHTSARAERKPSPLCTPRAPTARSFVDSRVKVSSHAVGSSRHITNGSHGEAQGEIARSAGA
jgi:hypothetical protein